MSASTAPASPAAVAPSWAHRLLLPTLAAGVFLGGLDQTVVVTGPNGGLSITGPPVVVVHNPVGSSTCSIEIDDVGALMNTTVGGTCGGFDITRTVSPAATGAPGPTAASPRFASRSTSRRACG